MISRLPAISSLSFKTALTALWITAALGAADDRPNFVFVIADDLRWDGLSLTGEPVVETPHIDRIGREGLIAENFFVTTPLCSPSRASFLTGNYAHSHRIINNDKNGLAAISHTLLTWPRLLRESGYETAFIGKWHMGFDDSRRPGFDHWISFKGQGLFIDPVVNEDGAQRQIDGYMTDYLNEKSAEFVGRKREKPFALYLSHKAVHFPYLPAPRHEELGADADLDFPEASAADLEGKPALSFRPPPLDILRLEGHTPEPPETRRNRGRDRRSIVLDQMRSMASVDEGVGMILEALERAGALDNTVVVFTSDNGFLLGEHGQFNQKRWAYDESIRIPFFLRYPPMVKAGSRLNQMLLNVDVAPTFLELAGVRNPEPMQGRSFTALLDDPQASGRQAFLAEYFREIVARTPHWQSVRTDRWKLIRYPDHPEFDELYDLRSDPGEEDNRIADPNLLTRRQELYQQLADLAADPAAGE